MARRRIKQQPYQTLKQHVFAVCCDRRMSDRWRASRALGRPLLTTQQVHHHSLTQLVICQDAAYHRLLHARAKAIGKPYTALRVLLAEDIIKRQKTHEWLVDFRNTGHITQALTDRVRQLQAQGYWPVVAKPENKS